MLPVLFSLGPVTIYSYGLFLAAGFLLAAYTIWKKAKEAHLEEEEIFDAIFVVTLSGLLGARFYYLLLHYQSFRLNLAKWLLITRYPGLAFHGALIFGLLALYGVVKKKKWSFWSMADIAVLGLVAGQIMGRIGCFLNGCCYGVVTDSIFGVKFPGSLEKRHPTQLYEAAGLFLIALLLNHVYKRYRFFSWYKGKKDEAEPGLTANFYLLFSGGLRFLIEFLRDDSVYWRGFKVAQLASLLMVLVGGFLVYKFSGRSWRGDGQALIERGIRMIKRRENGEN